MKTMKINEDGSVIRNDWRFGHRQVSFKSTPEAMWILAVLLRNSGYTFFEPYATFLRQGTGYLCVDLDQKDVFNTTDVPSVSIEKFLALCLPEERIMKIGDYITTIIKDKTAVKIGCQTIPKTKVKEILDLLN